jgi:hypothetical protein
MTRAPLYDPDEERRLTPRGPDGYGGNQALPDVAKAIREFNASNQAHATLWARARHAADAVRHSIAEESRAWQAAEEARDAHLAVLAEHPHRRACLHYQLIIAALAIALDGVACWFAAQALGGGQLETMVWTGLFLAVLGSAEVALDYYSDRNRRTWRMALAGLSAFIAGLGVLRFDYLVTVGTTGSGAAVVGAVLFTTATAGFVVIGYRALRAAETVPAWKARRHARRVTRAAEAARERLAAQVAERNRLVDAYVSRIRATLLDACTLDQLPQLEAILRLHLCGSTP